LNYFQSTLQNIFMLIKCIHCRKCPCGRRYM